MIPSRPGSDSDEGIYMRPPSALCYVSLRDDYGKLVREARKVVTHPKDHADSLPRPFFTIPFPQIISSYRLDRFSSSIYMSFLSSLTFHMHYTIDTNFSLSQN